MPQILADLNGTDKNTIIRILYDEGALNGQQIYRYRHLGILPPLEEGIVERKRKSNAPKRKIQQGGSALTIPSLIIDHAKQELDQSKKEYLKAKETVSAYEEILHFYERASANKYEF